MVYITIVLIVRRSDQLCQQDGLILKRRQSESKACYKRFENEDMIQRDSP